jgi:hypothetical protein
MTPLASWTMSGKQHALEKSRYHLLSYSLYAEGINHDSGSNFLENAKKADIE